MAVDESPSLGSGNELIGATSLKLEGNIRSDSTA
jgi:hypothetical protein